MNRPQSAELNDLPVPLSEKKKLLVVDCRRPKFTHFSRLLVQKDTLFKMPNSEIVYSDYKTLKNIKNPTLFSGRRGVGVLLMDVPLDGVPFSRQVWL